MNKKELSVGTAADKCTAVDISTSASLEQNGVLSAALSVEEGNRLIAKFMDEYDLYHWGRDPFNELLTATYHSSWNKLMSVVEKIESEEFPKSPDVTNGTCWPSVDIINKSEVEITLNDESLVFVNSFKSEGNKIKAVWLAVVDFIKWYNVNTAAVGSR